jgi:HAD superfamily hydrolase (TIGR01509 family)
MGGTCVVLDIGGVLELTPPTGWERRWEERLGLPAGGVAARMRDVWAAGTLGTIGEAQVHAEAAARLGLRPPQVEAFMADLWEEYLGSPNEELLACVRSLRGRCRLAALSVSFVGARERESALYHFDELFDAVLYSHETGVAKPDPRAFRAVCGELGVAAADCLFVDDAAVHVEAARAVGMHGHLFEDTAAAIARITAHVGPA